MPALAGMEWETGRLLHTVLRFRAAKPKGSSEDLAMAMSGRLGNPVTAVGTRQTLH